MSKIIAFILLVSFIGCTSIPKSEITDPKTSTVKNPKEILFIHGMFMTPVAWEGWQNFFKERGYKTEAVAWPQHDKSVAEMRDEKNYPALVSVSLEDVVQHYRNILKNRPVKPILIGHSMGGLVSQILLSEGLATAAVTLDSAPPKGVFVVSWSFLRSNWKIVSPFVSSDKPLIQTLDSFSYSFTNAQSPADQKRLFETYAVPESKRVGKGGLRDIAEVNKENARGPLLLVAGSDDHIIPAKLTYENFGYYDHTPAYTEFYLASGRDHSLLVSHGWEELADVAHQWLEKRLEKK